MYIALIISDIMNEITLILSRECVYIVFVSRLAIAEFERRFITEKALFTVKTY